MNISDASSDLGSFADHYSGLGDHELLLIAADRTSLGKSAACALTAEMTRRHLTLDSISAPGLSESERPIQQRPYNWGKFVGGLLAAHGIVMTGIFAFSKEPLATFLSCLVCVLGIGILQKRKWAVYAFEGLAWTFSLSFFVLTLFSKDESAGGIVVVEILFWLPQTVYFWRRHRELR